MADDLRFQVVRALRERVKDRDVADLARELGITVVKDGRINKGWVGQTLDRISKTKFISAPVPDGADFELKSVHVVARHGEWLPKETVAITMFNPEVILRGAFEESPLWHKLARLILVGHSYTDARRQAARIQFISPVDVSDPELRRQIEEYWNLIRQHVLSGTISSYSSKGTSAGFVQLRTKGSGKTRTVCPITGVSFNSRAFYATKAFVKYVRGNMG
jgi:DNA mismatch repair protein MutH